jgi:hypothetical protein
VVADLLRHLLSIHTPPTAPNLAQGPLWLPPQPPMGVGFGALMLPLDAPPVQRGHTMLFGGPHCLFHDGSHLWICKEKEEAVSACNCYEG